MKEDKEFTEINVIPLVDIMLVLLTIVLTTATFIVQGQIPVNLPKAQTAEERKSVNPVRIAITKNGKYFLNGREVSLEELKKELIKLPSETPTEIMADKDTKVEHLVKVLELINKKGMKNVALLVRTD